MIQNQFRVLLAKKETAAGRKFTYDDILAETGLSKTTIMAYANGRVSRFDASTLVTLCNWLPCELSDLIQYEPAPAV